MDFPLDQDTIWLSYVVALALSHTHKPHPIKMPKKRIVDFHLALRINTYIISILKSLYLALLMVFSVYPGVF